jgi:hypothetical protein
MTATAAACLGEILLRSGLHWCADNQATSYRRTAVSNNSTQQVDGWVSKPYTVALPGNADVLNAVRQLQGQQSAQQQGCSRKWWAEWEGASTAADHANMVSQTALRSCSRWTGG